MSWFGVWCCNIDFALAEGERAKQIIIIMTECETNDGHDVMYRRRGGGPWRFT